MLTWEDGYCESGNSSAVTNVSGHVVPSLLLNTMGNGCEGASGQDKWSVGDQIGAAVAKMSYQVFSLGEGIIGHVAFTSKHQWVFGERNCTNEAHSAVSVYENINPEYPTGWQNQFSAGIKTIAVVAVMPHGVVQLGSTQIIMENLEFVHHVKKLFGTLQNVPGAFLPDGIQDAVSGKIQAPIFPMMPFSITSPGNLASSGAIKATSFQKQSNQVTTKFPSLGVLDRFVSPVDLLEKNKSLPAQTLPLPSMGSFDSSVEMKNRVNLNNILTHITNARGTEMGEKRILHSASKEAYPFKRQLQANRSLSVASKHDTQQPLFSGSGKTLMEKLQFQGNMASDCQEECILNPLLGSDEIANVGNLCQDNFMISVGADGLLESSLFNSGRSELTDLKQMDVQLPIPILQGHAGHSEYCSSPSSLGTCNTNKTEMETTPMHVPMADAGNISYNVLSCSANIRTSACDLRESSDASWSLTADHTETKPLHGIGNSLMPSLGHDGLSMSNTLGINHRSMLGINYQPWHKGFLSDLPGLIQTNSVHRLNTDKKCSESFLPGFGKISAIPADCDKPGGNGDSDNCSYWPSKEQDDNAHAFMHVPSGAELLEALGPSFKKGTDKGMWNEMLFHGQDVCSSNLGTGNFGISHRSDYHSELDVSQSSDVSVVNAPEGWFFSETKSEDLLDAIVANVCPAPNRGTVDNISCRTVCSKITNSNSLPCASVMTDSISAGQLSVCDQKQSVLNISPPREYADLENDQNSNFSSEVHDDVGLKKSSNESSTCAQLKSLVREVRCQNRGLPQRKKLEEPIKVNRKRSRPGESSRPRPKDRQQIQDRVKELRDIVPNGAKCSIDALLERTIKHMVFLQSVSKYADKLKQSGESKVLDKEGGMLATNNVEGGATWAFELGGSTVQCPLIVENLNQPRQMLVEMLCEERGLFLEIADIIRGLGLTILKGIMEVRNDKIWAHFIVEANRDVHRVDILWSLMQLLQPNTKSTTNTINQSFLVRSQGIDNVSQTYDAFQLSPMSTLLTNGAVSGS